MPTAALDTRRQVFTPEACEITLRIAGPVARARAWMLDFLIRLVCWVVLGFGSGWLGGFGVGWFFVFIFLLEWAYPVLFEVLRKGQTPGKRLCGLAVMQDDGRPVGWGPSALRNLLRAVDMLPVLYATAFVSMLLDRHARRLGDLAAGTVVVHVALPAVAAGSKADARHFAVLGSEAPPAGLTLEEQKTLIEFRNRAQHLTAERTEELAMLALPLLGESHKPHRAVRRLMRMANFLLGHHDTPTAAIRPENDGQRPG